MHICLVSCLQILGTWISLEWQPSTALRCIAGRLWLVQTMLSSTEPQWNPTLTTTGKNKLIMFKDVGLFFPCPLRGQLPYLIDQYCLLLLNVFFLIVLFYGIGLWEKEFLMFIDAMLHHIYALMLIVQKEE
jgi:hypothetical protein